MKLNGFANDRFALNQKDRPPETAAFLSNNGCALSHQHAHRVFDQPLERLQQFCAERTIDRAVIA